MNGSRTTHILCIALAGFILGCSKPNEDLLTEEFDALEGRYEWTHSIDYNLFGPADYLYQNQNGTVATFELDDEGQIAFYEDGELIVKKKYKIESQQQYISDSSLHTHIEININVAKRKLDLNNQSPLSITLIGDSIVTTNQFPVPSIIDGGATDNYFIRY